jgi:hypothetical protein
MVGFVCLMLLGIVIVSRSGGKSKGHPGDAQLRI